MKNLGLLVFIQKVLGPIYRLVFHLKVSGLENVPEKGGAVICCNHLNALDPVTVGCVLKRTFRTMAKEELFKNKLVGFFISALGGFPVARGKGDTGAIDTAEAIVRNGELFLIYPEGTRSKTGEMGRIKSGAAVVAASTGADIIPAYITMASTKLNPFRKMAITFGKPLTSKDLFGTDEVVPEELPRRAYGNACNILKEKMLELKDESVL